MPYSEAAKNLMLDELADVAVWVSLHDDDPGDSGANEISGGSPAYARKAITWNAASGGEITGDSLPTLDVPASTEVTHIGFWSAETNGTFYGSDELDEPEVFGAQGTLTLQSAMLALNIDV